MKLLAMAKAHDCLFSGHLAAAFQNREAALKARKNQSVTNVLALVTDLVFLEGVFWPVNITISS